MSLIKGLYPIFGVKKIGGNKFLFPIVHNEDEKLMEKLNSITPLVHNCFKKNDCMECKF